MNSSCTSSWRGLQDQKALPSLMWVHLWDPKQLVIVFLSLVIFVFTLPTQIPQGMKSLFPFPVLSKWVNILNYMAEKFCFKYACIMTDVLSKTEELPKIGARAVFLSFLSFFFNRNCFVNWNLPEFHDLNWGYHVFYTKRLFTQMFLIILSHRRVKRYIPIAPCNLWSAFIYIVYFAVMTLWDRLYHPYFR